jgi:hypothetical protein
MDTDKTALSREQLDLSIQQYLERGGMIRRLPDQPVEPPQAIFVDRSEWEIWSELEEVVFG